VIVFGAKLKDSSMFDIDKLLIETINSVKQIDDYYGSIHDKDYCFDINEWIDVTIDGNNGWFYINGGVNNKSDLIYKVKKWNDKDKQTLIFHIEEYLLTNV
jgi:hypothetical protein